MFTDRNRAIQERQMSHDFYRSGIDHYAGEYDEAAMFDFINQMPHITQTTTSPWINVTDDARQSTYNAFMEDNYNPFIGNEGAWVTPEGNDLRGSNNGTAEGYRDDSISAYLKGAFAGQDQVKNRANALRNFKKWNGTERGINTASTRMNQRYFDQLGLADFGLEYKDPRQEAYDNMVATFSGPSEGTTGGFTDAYNSSRPTRFLHSGDLGNSGGFGDNDQTKMVHGHMPDGMMTGGARPAAAPNAGGGFMAAYQAKRDALASKPSVMSLMTELKDA